MLGFFFRINRKRYRYRKPKPKIERLIQHETSNEAVALSGTAIKKIIDDLPTVQVKQVIDGDTVVVNKHDQLIKVRLDAIDCPEDGQEWGDNAKYGLIKLIGGRLINLEEHGVDHHGRLLATIYVFDKESGWVNVNEKMVTKGHAWVMRLFYDHLPKDRQTKLNQLERWAKSKKIGLWRKGNPTPPWEWRNNHN